MMPLMGEYDVARLAELGKRYEQERAAAEATRKELTPEIVAAARAGVRQVEIVRATGLTRERVRQICLAANVSEADS